MTTPADPTLPVQGQLAAYNARDIEAFMAFWAEDCRYHAFPDQLLAQGRAAVRARHVARFREPDLFGRLHRRFAIGHLVVDHETVTRNFPEGAGEVDVVALYEVRDGLIAQAWFHTSPARMRKDDGEAAHTVTLPGGHAISDDRARLDMDFVHAGLATTPWARERSRAMTERAWAHSLAFGLYAPDGRMRGCARLVTDHTFRAHLADVFIAPEARSQGLGQALVEAILAHPGLRSVTHWTLTTVDAQGLYARYGFQATGADGQWMTMQRPAG